METPSNSLKDAQPLSKGGRSKSVDAAMLDVFPLCYKNPDRVRRSRSTTSLRPSFIQQSTFGPPNGTPTQSLPNPSAGGIDRAATGTEGNTPTPGSQNLEIKVTKVSPRGSFYELNPAALRLNIPSPIYRDLVEDAHSEVLRRNDRFTLGDGIQRSSHKPPSYSSNRRVVTLPGLSTVYKPLNKSASTQGSKRDLAVAAELRAFTEGAFEWLAEQVLLEGFDIDGNSFDEEPSIPSFSAGSCDVWDFSPPTPSNLPLPLLPAPFIVNEPGYIQDALHQRGIEREIPHLNSSERGFDPQVSQGNTNDVKATSRAYSMKNCDSICVGGNCNKRVVDTRARVRNPAGLVSEQDPREPFIKASNRLHLDIPESLLDDDGLPRYHPSSTASSQTPSPLTESEPRTQSNVTAISDTKLSAPTSICCQLKCIHPEPAVGARTPPSTTPGWPRANTVDGFTPKSRSIFAKPRKMVGKAMAEAAQIVTPCPSLATVSSLARPRALSSPQTINIAIHTSTSTENTKTLFTSVGHSNWDSTMTDERIIWAPQSILPSTSYSDGRSINSIPMQEPSDPLSSASVGPSSPRSGRVPVSPELCKVTKNFSRPTRLF